MKLKIVFMLGLLAVFALSACSDDGNEPVVVAVESVSISPSSVSVERDKTCQLKAEISPQEATDKKVSWSSSNSQVATVSENGLVTGVSKGTATITVTAGGKKATCQVTVTWEVQSVTVSPVSLKMTQAGETAQLTAAVLPEGAGEAVWSSSNEAVATVSPEGLVTAVGQGIATITATAGDKTATCEVTVEISIIEVEDGQATVQLDGGSQEELVEAISKTAQEGVTRFVLVGDYSGLGRWTTNIFNGIKAEVIDFSGVTGWPVNEDGLASVDANAFYTYQGSDFTGIQKVVLPEEVQAIGGYAFYKCTGLKSVIAPGVQVVDQGAFYDCSSLTEVEMPELTEIGSVSFYLSGLKKVNFPKVVAVGSSAFGMCFQLIEASLPKVKVLGAIAPEDATSRDNIRVFGDCSKLEKVYLPAVTTVGDFVFDGCTELKELDLPEATEFGISALGGCTALVSVRLPKATYFSRDVFTDCESLSKLYLVAEGGISVKNTTFGPVDNVTKNVDLTLHPNKESEVKDSWVGEGKEWKSHNWKSISFAEN